MSGTKMRGIALCADDFGANPAACLAIDDLAARGAISATSCLVDAPDCRRFAHTLRAHAPRLALGLHLDLIEFAPEPIRAPLNRWLVRGFLLHNVDSAAVRAEIGRQLSRFEDLFGSAPEFADGHCHVHQIPGIREPLLEELQRRYGRRVAVRSTRSLRHHNLKGRFIEQLGGRTLHALIDRLQLHCNSDFAGAYDLKPDAGFALLMRHWLRDIADGGLIMCHPEMPASHGAPRTARGNEYRFLASPGWRNLQSQLQVQLRPFLAA